MARIPEFPHGPSGHEQSLTAAVPGTSLILSIGAGLFTLGKGRCPTISDIPFSIPPHPRSESGRGKGSSPNSASLTPKPLASSAYVHVLEAPSPLKRSILVTSLFPSAVERLNGKRYHLE